MARSLPTTYPLIGNYGMNSEGQRRAARSGTKGYIVREACTTPSNFRSEETLDNFPERKRHYRTLRALIPAPDPHPARKRLFMNGAITTEFDPETEPEKLAA